MLERIGNLLNRPRTGIDTNILVLVHAGGVERAVVVFNYLDAQQELPIGTPGRTVDQWHCDHPLNRCFAAFLPEFGGLEQVH